MELQFFQDQILPTLPNEAGVYRFFGENDKVLYVGKAKNIKKRVVSYFVKSNQHSSRIKLLVRKASRIEFTIVDTEQDALLLENSLIKKHQPKYNIQLKDDKTYPFICIKNEPFPRVFLTRNRIKDGSEYLGPYTSVHKVRTILEFIKSLYTLRTCNYSLTESNIIQNKFKVCLEYHIGNCLGPCEGLQSEDDYNRSIEEIKSILKGNSAGVIRLLRDQMQEYAQNMEFEKAESARFKIEILEKYQAKSTIVNPAINNIDVYAVEDTPNAVFITYFKVVNGAIIHAHSVQAQNKSDESLEDILIFAIQQIREEFKSSSREIIVPFKINYPFEDLKITVPNRGDKKKLLELAHDNAVQFKNQTLTKLDKYKAKNSYERVLQQLKHDFNMKKLPDHIECFDNSNIQGSNPVASMVVFKNARPSKKDYRHYNIKTVEGPNDFASMEEVVFRRYKRLLEEEQPLPQLILIDGGKGQLSAAMKSIEMLQLKDKVTVAAIAKKLEEIYFPGDPVPLYINKKSTSLKLLQNIRNEAHRFAINFHRQKRSKAAINSELLEIRGVGEKTAQKLLSHFKSVKKVREASFEEIESVAGKKTAKLLKQYFSVK